MLNIFGIEKVVQNMGGGEASRGGDGAAVVANRGCCDATLPLLYESTRREPG